MAKSVAAAFELTPYFVEPQLYTFNSAAGITLQGTSDRVAAKFYAPATITVDKVDVVFVKTGSPSAVVVTLEIQTDTSDAPSGTTVGSVSANQTLVTTNAFVGAGTPISVGTANLTVNTPYWLVVKVVSATTLNSSNTWGLKHAGTGNSLNRGKLRRFNATDWTTVTAISAPALIVLHDNTNGVYFGHPVTGTPALAATAIGGGANNRQGLRFKVGSKCALAGVVCKLGKQNTPANLLVEVYKSTDTTALYSATINVGEITDQVEFTVWFATPVAVAKNTNTYVVLSSDSSTATNQYATYGTPIQTQYISAIYPTDWRYVFGVWTVGTTTGDALTIDSTVLVSIAPILTDPAADLSEAAGNTFIFTMMD